MKNFFKNMFFLMIKNSLLNLPTPININYWWNMGSILGLCLSLQILTGLFLSFHYTPHISYAFHSIIHMNQNMNYGWLFHFMHMNGASFFFLFLYFHVGRSLYYGGFMNKNTWLSGIIIIFLLMGTSFIGYVLPWGQMSLWGATVITNLVSAMPIVGKSIVMWLWGGFSISNPTLNRFYSFHFILPFILLMFVLIHIILLHEKGSTSPIGVTTNIFKVPFHPYFTYKDLFGFLIFLSLMFLFIMQYPNILLDPENFIEAQWDKTPQHIQPEWYFLFAYAILRTIPNKIGGIMALIMSILILMIMPFYFKNNIFKSSRFQLMMKIFNWMFFMNFWILTWLAMKPAGVYPFLNISFLSSFIYFTYFLIPPLLLKNYKLKNLI